MKAIVDRKTMQEIDRVTIEEIGIPSMVLMERAALKVFLRIQDKILAKKEDPKKERVLVVCGIGNNGGDGIAVARLLFEAKIPVSIQLLGSKEKFTKEMSMQVKIVEKLGVPFVEQPTYNDYSIIVDAIFGVGLTRMITGEYETVIHEVNKSNAIVVAVDLPSGINADDGSIMNVAIKADYTVTFGYQKVGLVRYPGREYGGDIYVEDVGFPSQVFDLVKKNNQDYVDSFIYTKDDLNRVPIRPKHSHKGTFGTVLVIAGSKGMSGACYLSAKAAYRTGAGLIKVLTVKENRQIIQTLLPEAVVLTYGEEELEDQRIRESYIKEFNHAKCIIIGPGIGINHQSEKILQFVLENAKIPIVIDADAINILAKWIDKQIVRDHYEKLDMRDQVTMRLNILLKIIPQNVVLTPHLKEFSRLLDQNIEKINKNFIDMVDLCFYNKVLICIIKDSVTTVLSNKKRYYNTSGNDALATGGSGDVLTGIIGSFISQGLDAFEASCLGVYVHGLTAEYYSEQNYKGSMMASDIVETIGKVII